MTTTEQQAPAALHSRATTATPGVSARTGGVAGLAFFLLYFVSSGMLLGPISQTDSVQKVQTTFADQADTIDVACALLVLSIPLLLVFALALQAALPPTTVGFASLVLPAAAAAAALTLAAQP